MTYAHARYQGQRSLSPTVKSGNVWTETIAFPPVLSRLLIRGIVYEMT